MKTIEELERESEELEEVIWQFKDKLKACKDARLSLMSPFKVGDIIEWKSRRTTSSKGRVTGLLGFCNSPMWLVRNIRKDGSDGATSLVSYYDNPNLVQRAVD